MGARVCECGRGCVSVGEGVYGWARVCLWRGRGCVCECGRGCVSVSEGV